MEPVILRGGAFALEFRPEEGMVGRVWTTIAGYREISRGITAPVRDSAWGTVPAVISDLSIQQDAGAFRVAFTARCRRGEIDFRWRGTLSSSGDRQVVFTFEGEALRRFRANRVGFCFLHPAECAGRPCEIEHTDGSREKTRFPRSIAPHQPFLDVRAIAHALSPRLTAEVRLEGETFETEDQRNWTDASFKTYCRPLSKPFPFLLQRGTRIRQSITLSLHGAVPARRPRARAPWVPPTLVTVRLSRPRTTTLPALGAILSPQKLSPAKRSALRTLGLAHLRVDLDLGRQRWPDSLRQALHTATVTDCALEVALFLPARFNAVLRHLRSDLQRRRPAVRIARWLVFQRNGNAAEPDQLASVREILAGIADNAPFGTGATENFTELNRNPAAAKTADFSVHAFNPQVHAFDDGSVISTLPIQGDTVREARRLSQGRPAVVSPLTLTRRWRIGETNAPKTATPLPPFQDDPRFSDSFTAAWTLASLAILSHAGAASVTCFETTGANGLLDAAGRLRPVAKLLRRAAHFTGQPLARIVSNHPHLITGLALHLANRWKVLLANLSPHRQRVRLVSPLGPREITLSSYAVRFLHF